jgi:hypothetical protein
MFFPFRRNPIIMRIDPKNPNQLSVEIENEDDDSVDLVRALMSTPDSPETVATGAIIDLS